MKIDGFEAYQHFLQVIKDGDEKLTSFFVMACSTQIKCYPFPLKMLDMYNGRAYIGADQDPHHGAGRGPRKATVSSLSSCQTV